MAATLALPKNKPWVQAVKTLPAINQKYDGARAQNA